MKKRGKFNLEFFGKITKYFATKKAVSHLISFLGLETSLFTDSLPSDDETLLALCLGAKNDLQKHVALINYYS